MASSKSFNTDLRDLNRRRMEVKADFTATKFKLASAVQTGHKSEVIDSSEIFDAVFGDLIRLNVRLSEMCLSVEDFDTVDEIQAELENVEMEYDGTKRRVQSYLDEQIKCGSQRNGSRSDVTVDKKEKSTSEGLRHRAVSLNSELEKAILKTELDIQDIKSKLEESINETKGRPSRQHDSPKKNRDNVKHELGSDMWKQLKRVSIPVFGGDKRQYESWKASFVACIDQAPATPEYKLLQLRQHLSGEALHTIESLGHSATAYTTAKERLDRKYGGRRRQIGLYLEELERFKPLRQGNANDIERFADLLDIAVVNLKEAGRTDELTDGSLYKKHQ